jgi:hypothetical protein
MPLRQSPLLRHFFPILLASSLVLSTPSMRAQKLPPLAEIQARTLDGSTQLAPVPEATGHLGPAPGILPEAPRSQTDRSQTDLRVELFSYHHTLTNPRAALNLQQPTGTAELPGKAKYFTGSASSQWLTSANGSVHYPAIHPADHLQYYGHHIPWAGSLIPRVSHQANAHPHVTSVLKLFKPQF